MTQLPNNLREALLEFHLAHDDGDPDRCLEATEVLCTVLTSSNVVPLLLSPTDFSNSF